MPSHDKPTRKKTRIARPRTGAKKLRPRGTKGPAIGTRGNPRPVHVLPKDYALKDGETYEGWPCRACAYFITIDQSWPDAARISDAHYVVAVCPQCKTSRLGTWGGKERRQYVHAPANRPPP
jgi:hypothetical protein